MLFAAYRRTGQSPEALTAFLALSFATIGFLTKLLAEGREDIDQVQAAAVRNTGTSWRQVPNHGIRQQARSRLIGLFESAADRESDGQGRSPGRRFAGEP